jgi:hypothetical protein
MEKEIEIWYSEYELRNFIHMALRWKIEGIYKSRTAQKPFSVFTYMIENARENFDKFCTQLNRKLTGTNNWKAIEIDLKYRFLPMINQYLEWYNINQIEFKKFEPYCPYTLMQSIVESTKDEILKYFPESNTALLHQKTITKKELEIIEIKPVLKAEAIQPLFEIIKVFFNVQQQTELKQILETGNTINGKLLFKGSGHRLADTFKKLIDNNFYTCQKQDLEKWILMNFKFLNKNKPSDFKTSVLNKYISTYSTNCKNPLIEINKGQIQKVEEPRTKKYNKH